jgi:hypothetical protein
VNAALGEFKMIEQALLLRLIDGSTRQATVTRKDSDPDCWLQVSCVGIKESSTGSSYFEALSIIRERLAEHHIFPLCYGASRNVWPSGMACDFTQALVAYRLEMGLPGEVRVNIFESGPDVDPVTPKEQKAFYRKWLKSLK